MLNQSVKTYLLNAAAIAAFPVFLSITPLEANIGVDDLTNDTWGPEEMSLGYYIEFKSDGSYVKNFAGPGSWMCTGKYSISNGVVALGRGEFADATPRDYMDCEKKQCTIKEDNASFYRTKVLSCKPGKAQYWKKSAIVKPGLETKVQGYSVILMGVKKAQVKTAMKVRFKPDAESKAYYFDSLEGAGGRDSLPKGHEIEILARTKDKVKVGDNLNYWFYVDLGTADAFCAQGIKKNICESRGWIFGQWIEFKD